MLLQKVTKVTTGQQKLPKMGQNSKITPFLPEGQKKPQPKAEAKIKDAIAKIKDAINTKEDVEKLQENLKNLYLWEAYNKMRFNGSKFQVVRYGQNEEIKTAQCISLPEWRM